MQVVMTSNVGEFKNACKSAVARALEICGGKGESYAKSLCTVQTGNLRNSITHKPESDDTMLIGAGAEYAPYVELGHHQEPGRYVPAIGKRLVASYVSPKPFLRPAIEGHAAEFRTVIERELKNA